MKRIFERANKYLQGLSTIKFIIVIVLLTYLTFMIFFPLIYLYEEYIGQMGGPENLNAASVESQIIIGSIIGPLIETFIFQYGIIEILSSTKIFKEKNIIIAVISSLLFGISHSYSYIYMVYAFIIGLLLAYSYFVYRKKGFSAFWIVFIIHGIRNTISTILIYFNI
ncbi:CPBP family intramembrane glutamic endopeptidase [Clostridium sp. C2-6-12]|uniref:CPBP family intramembrane glutamic endopeptidase n=1 Tax=Clostridium sp. C2-6-12 TaxID=2698832 RepID=UPI00136B51D5|nr:CPBP family intramembrane glutamic endopeptidase [Clostridium sp. C2-6-12]